MVYEFHHAVSVTQVVHCDCLSKHIIANAAHLNSKGGEQSASINESRSLESYGIVSFVHNKHSDDSFIAVDYEVTSELEAVFLLLCQFFFTQTIKVAELASYHHWDFSEAHRNFFFWLVVELASNSSVQWSLICCRS